MSELATMAKFKVESLLKSTFFLQLLTSSVAEHQLQIIEIKKLGGLKLMTPWIPQILCEFSSESQKVDENFISHAHTRDNA